jgi:hypothetical protein
VDGHGQHRDTVPLGEAQAGIAAADGRLEGALEGPEGQFEVDGVVGFGRLDVVVVKDEVDREGAGAVRLSDRVAGVKSKKDVRPYLRSRVGDHGEADRVVVEAHPRDLLERVERCRELWGTEIVSRNLVGDAMSGLLENVLTFLRSVLKRILATRSSHVLLWPSWIADR